MASSSSSSTWVFKNLLPLLLLLSCFSEPTLQEQVNVRVRAVTTIATTDDIFVCATVDWWPKEKCNYGMCPWGQSSIHHLDLNNPILYSALKAFNGSLRVRLGGSMQDQVLYDVGAAKPSTCSEFALDPNGRFGFSEACLNMTRWDQLNAFFNQTGVKLTFGLNALNGRKQVSADGEFVGEWDATNARDFINYTLSKGYDIEAWELGNELCGSGVSGNVKAAQYAADMVALRNTVKKLYTDHRLQDHQPKLLAPGGFYDAGWFGELLAASGPGVVDVVTHHLYNLGSGMDENLIYKMQDPYFLDQVAQTYNDVANTITGSGPWASAWVGESGGAYNSGGKVSHSFVDGFWYLDQLGMASVFNHKAFCRQALIGGNYALLNTINFTPNPDYYSALLWRRLMSRSVLLTTHDGSPFLRTYTHCTRDKPGMTMLVINLSNSTSYDVSVSADLNVYPPHMAGGESSVAVQGAREEYRLSPEGGDLRSQTVLLNGRPLRVNAATGEIPDMCPMPVDASAPIHVSPSSVVFISFNDFIPPACSH